MRSGRFRSAPRRRPGVPDRRICAGPGDNGTGTRRGAPARTTEPACPHADGRRAVAVVAPSGFPTPTCCVTTVPRGTVCRGRRSGPRLDRRRLPQRRRTAHHEQRRCAATVADWKQWQRLQLVAGSLQVNGTEQSLNQYIAGLRDVIRAFPDYRWDLRHLLIDGCWISAHFHDTGTHRGTFPGRPRDGPGGQHAGVRPVPAARRPHRGGMGHRRRPAPAESAALTGIRPAGFRRRGGRTTKGRTR